MLIERILVFSIHRRWLIVLATLAAAPERDMPPGLAAQIEMARVVANQAA